MQLRNAVPRQGTETRLWFLVASVNDKLRNAVPRQGTETKARKIGENDVAIEKCSSPTGDGNQGLIFLYILQ